jgi:hypothetical protein
MTLALVLFALAAAGGSFLAYLRFSDKPLPMGLALGHGAGAVAGLVALLLVVLRAGGGGHASLALGLFAAAALGGLTLFSFHMRSKALPIGLVVGHGLLALAALIVLALGVMRAS